MSVDDAALLRALQEGKQEAFATLFEDHADRLYRLALGLLRDPVEAEDVVQDTFLAAISHLDRFEGRSRLSTWLYRVAYNACMDRLRKREAVSLPEEDPDSDAAEPPLPRTLVEWEITPEAVLEDEELRAALDAAVADLPETQRAVFILRDIDERSTAETAAALDISPGAVKVRLHRARLALRERLADVFVERLEREEEAP